MSSSVQSSIRTLGEVFSMMAPFAGGSIPTVDSDEYNNWILWVQQAQEEYARRGFWRRCLTRAELTLSGETTLLPDRFHKPNGLYMVIVDGIDWMDADNTDEQSIFVEMDNAPFEDDDVTPNANFGKWQMRFRDEVTTAVTAVVWYFSNPPKPTLSADILLLPGDMIGYKALGEYYRTSGAEGSQDKSEEDAENRFQEYLTLETIPSTNELLRFQRSNTKTDRLVEAKRFYRSRPGRSIT